MEYIRIGTIVNTFGIKGELKIKSLTDFPDERFAKGLTVYLDYQGKYLPVVSAGYRLYKEFVLFRIKDNEDINLVEKYKGCDVYFDRAQIKDLDDGYYFFQLKDCDVYCDGKPYGKVISVEEGYQTILRIKTDHGEVLMPYVDAFVLNVDAVNKRIDVRIIDGM
ncbi:MAG: 16S rRNA processing protein RimM [Erysipelotrichaceae bacterium]|nr:16S rRNA processing protein RimM [Erysipelotrichaceae bacterium]